MGKKLYVGNIPYTATEEALSQAFSECGQVESVRIVTDRETGRSKGFAFVEMGADDQAQEAISKWNGAQWGGRSMTVNEARPQPERGERPRRDFGGDDRGPRGFGSGPRR